jgi:3-hydroxyisobutyrate dehydrogenase-like beta-hydroxyacid dehydrogenase
MRIGIVGGGEVGHVYAEALVEQGRHAVTVCDPHPRGELTSAAKTLGFGLEPGAGPWLADVDRVWLCVPGDLVPKVLADVLAFAASGSTIVDLTTASPDVKRASAARAGDEGVNYVDAVILGAVSVTKARTPLLAVGPAAEEAMGDFIEIGAPVKTLPAAQPGDAAALKLLRTILTKGLEALAIECLVAAERQGVRGELYEAMSDVDALGFTGFLDMLITTGTQHCVRRLNEVERAEAQLTSMGLPASMLAASRAVFARSVAGRERSVPPAAASTDPRAALAWLQTVTVNEEGSLR